MMYLLDMASFDDSYDLLHFVEIVLQSLHLVFVFYSEIVVMHIVAVELFVVEAVVHSFVDDLHNYSYIGKHNFVVNYNIVVADFDYNIVVADFDYNIVVADFDCDIVVADVVVDVVFVDFDCDIVVADVVVDFE